MAVPPGIEEAGPVLRLHRRLLELVPVAVSVARREVAGDRIEIPQQHTIQRSRGGPQLVAVTGTDDFFDQRVDHRVLDARGITTVLAIRCGRAPVVPEFGPRRQRLRVTPDRRFVVELTEPVDELRHFDGANGGIDAEPLERIQKRHQRPLQVHAHRQELDREGGARLAVNQHTVPDDVARLLE